MKKVMVFILLFLAGCQQQNLTWTPTSEEWASMTPEQRNEWSANELYWRQVRDKMWQRIQQNKIEQTALSMAQYRIIAHDLGINTASCHNCTQACNHGGIDLSSPTAFEREASGVGAVRNLWPYQP